MRFSIVIPTYNSKVSLKNTLESLNYQTGYSADDYEVIVSDDGSNDGTYEYIKDAPKNYKMKHIYLERCEKSCRSRTRNEGRRAAQGEIINYMDSDIIVKQDYLFEVDRYFKVSDRFCLLGNRLMIDDPVCFDDIRTQRVFSLYPFNPTMYEQLEFRHYLYQQYSYNANAIAVPWMQVYSCNIIAAKRWLDVIDGFDENIIKWGMEDVEFGYSLYKYGLLFAINPKLEVLHQNHGARNDLIVEKSKVEAYDRNIDYFLKKHPEALSVRKSIAYKFLKGEIPMHKFNIVLPKKDIHLSYNSTVDVEKLKNEILKYVNEEHYNIILEDYLENADLDLWTQLLGKTKSVVRYFPQSKKVNIKEMAAFIDAERERQIECDNQKHLQLA